ncbi:MAG: peptidylprolyl isomerase [Campylobacterales bacterium]
MTTAAAPWLNGGYTIFGYVTKGMDTVYKRENVPTSGRRGGDRPLQKQTIVKATVTQ